jgi:hypothetical protein
MCVVRHPDCYGWTGIFVLPPFFTKRFKVCVCVCVSALSPPRGEEKKAYKHISSGEMIRTPLLRKEAPKSTVAETIFECEKF